MKAFFYLLVILCMLTVSATAQNEYGVFDIGKIPKKDGLPYYEKIVTLDSSYTKDVIYSAAKKVLIMLFADAKQVIQQDDKEAGEITGKGLTHFSYTTKAPLGMKIITRCRATFIFEISIKPGKYRVRIYNHEIEAYSDPLKSWVYGNYSEFEEPANNGNKPAIEFLKAFHQSNKDLLREIKTGIVGKTKEQQQDNW